ncbi:tartrate dehydrogenase, partial [bacterium]|nr:tartrate dehydrogenase [bacterium]
MKTYRIAAVPGDGVGPEVIPAGLLVLGRAADRFGFSIETTTFEWGAGYYKKHGHFMPKDGLDFLSVF